MRLREEDAHRLRPHLGPGSGPRLAARCPAGYRLRQGLLEKACSAQRKRPELLAALAYLRSEDTLIVWKLDRLARSFKQLIETIEGMEAGEVGFRSLTEAIDTTTSGGRLIFHISHPSPNSSALSSVTAPARDWNPPGPVAVLVAGRRTYPGRPAAAKALLSDPMITVEEVVISSVSPPPPSTAIFPADAAPPRGLRKIRNEFAKKTGNPRRAEADRTQETHHHYAVHPEGEHRMGLHER